jgi:hypothetical protein
MSLWWEFSAFATLPFGLIVLFIITLPLHLSISKSVSKIVDFLLGIEFFGMQVPILKSKITFFHVILFVYGLSFVMLWSPWDNVDHSDSATPTATFARWRKERNMYISALIWVVYFMIFQYHTLRKKFDALKSGGKEVSI